MSDTESTINLPDITALIDKLKKPVHTKNILDPARKIRNVEADLSKGYFIYTENAEFVSETVLSDFKEFMEKSLSVCENKYGYPIELNILPASNCDSQDDSFSMNIDGSRCMIKCSAPEGVRRALFYLEDEMIIRRAPFLPYGHWKKTTEIHERICRSPVAIYHEVGQVLLDDFPDPYPDEYLSRMSHMGVNAIWVNGDFKSLIATKAIPELGSEKTRLDRLAKLAEKTSRYGIKVFFFYMEPRLTMDQALFEKYPDIRGARFPKEISQGEHAICTSAPRVQDYLREAMSVLFKNAPGLAGVIEIFHGERGTNCWMTGKNLKHPENGCPRCASIPVHNGLASKLNCIYDGIRSVNPIGKLLAWDYMPTKEKLRVLPLLNKNIVWLSCFEHGGRKKIKRKIRTLHEYSLSYTGPTHIYKQIKGLAAAEEVRVYSKLQLGTTFELPSQPYIPVPSSVYRKFKGMHETGTSGTMLNWVIGGYPSMMFKVAGESCFSPLEKENNILRRAAAITWGEKHSPAVVKAWKIFFKAFSLYPMDIEVFYKGPITRSPGYHLNLEKEEKIAYLYNWGLGFFDRQIQPYEDDPSRWTGTFTEREVIDSFREMVEIWHEGVEILRSLTMKEELKKDPFSADMREQADVAEGVLIQLASCANVIEFYSLRKEKEKATLSHEKNKILERMKDLLLADTELAQKMRSLLETNPFMGFHSEMFNYSVSPSLIDEKIKNDQETLRKIIREVRECENSKVREFENVGVHSFSVS